MKDKERTSIIIINIIIIQMHLFVSFCLFSLDESEKNLLGTESEKQEILIQAYITHMIFISGKKKIY